MKTRTRTSKTKKRSRRTEAIVPVKLPQKKLSLERQKPEDSSCVAVYLASLGSEKSRVSVYDALKRVIRVLNFRMENSLVTVEEFPWEKLRYRHMHIIRSKLSGGKLPGEKPDADGDVPRWSPNTVNHTLCAVRGVLEVAWNQHKMTTDDYQRAKSVKGIKGSRVQAGRHIKTKEIEKLFGVCDDGLSGVRDSALLAMLYGCGMRRAEAAEAMVDALDLDKKSIRLVGKGNKERVIFLPPGTVQAMRRWIELRGDGPGQLFPAINKYGQILGRGISDEAIRKIVKRIEKAAKIKHISPHDFRRTYIGDMLETGADIVTVQKLAGHSSPTTTSRYDRRGEKTQKKAASKLKVPFKKDSLPEKKRSDSKENRHANTDYQDV